MSTKDLLLDVIRDRPGLTREQILAASELPSGTADPSRIRLWEAGLIEPDTEAGWSDALANRVKTVGWCSVEDPLRQNEVQARAAARKKRNAKPGAEKQAKDIVQALQDPTVNRLVLEMTKDGAGSRRAQRHAEQTLRAQHMARKRVAKQAEREKAANADFKRMLGHLWDARGAVGAIDRHLIEERARMAQGEARRIADEDWATALTDVRTLIKSFGAMWRNVRELGEKDEPCPACGAPELDEDRHLGAFVVTAEAEEIVDAEVVPT